MKEPCDENHKCKELVAELGLDATILREARGRSW